MKKLLLVLTALNLCAQTTRVKCPAADGMKFTQGLPLRVLADGIDPNGWQWHETQSEAALVRFIVDGVQKDSTDYTRGYNHFEVVMTGLSLGAHTLTTQSVNYNNVIANSGPRTIEIVPLPVKTNTVNLTADLNLSGATNLDWQDVVVRGNGFRVTSAAGWTGRITIRNAFVTGLGVAAATVPTTSNSPSGISLTTNGSVDIETSVFEWTGAVNLTVNGSATITIKNNEFRSSMYIPFVSSDPDRSPFMEIKGSASGRKVFQGNNVGTGHLLITGMSGWLIGGNADSTVNVFIGPRMGTYLVNCSGDTLRGNYMHHDYYGGWSQGFCFRFQSCSNILGEHNVIRGSSWPVQSMAGEFRYNLVVESGHEWVRTLGNNTLFHHNVLMDPGPGGDPNAGIWIYNNTTGVKLYNNTLDGGLASPAVSASKGSLYASLRNNIFMGFKTNAINSVVDRYMPTNAEEHDSVPRLLYADYNCFYNPNSTGPHNYGAFLVGAVAENTPGWGTYDLGTGLDRQTNPQLTGGTAINYDTDESKVWDRTLGLSAVLADYRNRYSPKTGSPVIDAGDPADGAGVDIGAVGAGQSDPNDLFGKFGQGNIAVETGRFVAAEGFALSAMPNPFRSSVAFGFELHTDGRPTLPVKLSVYNAAGRRVAALLHGTMLPGGHRISWNAWGMPSGLYVIRLQVNDRSWSKPLILLK